jgi:hypothetical protein
MTTEPERKDHVLGAALRSLTVPEHRQGFKDELLAELDQAGSNSRHHRRRSRPRRSASPRRSRRPWTWGLATAAAVTAIVIVVVTAGLPGSGPRPATAAEVIEEVTSAWAAAQSISGELVVNNEAAFGPGERRWAFVLTARGDFRLNELTRGGQVAYDASENVERSLNPSESIDDSPVLFASERSGLAPAPPDQSPSLDILDRSLGSVIRALAAGGEGEVQEVSHDGRPAWLLDTAIRPNLIAGDLAPNHLRVTVDQETGFPVNVVATRDGQTLLWETQLRDLEVDAAVSADDFHLDFPPGTEVFRTDEGFRRVSLDEVGEIVSYEPVVPSWIPEGYELAEATTSQTPGFTGAEGGNPLVGNIVSLSYRRGLDHLIVTTRPVGDDPAAWADPLATGEGFVDEPDRVTFSSGVLEGREGELLIDPLAIPHVWAMTDRLVVTVSGDLTPEEILRVASSLR